jgi:enoyl-CoA hydratase/carnithine racemase
MASTDSAGEYRCWDQDGVLSFVFTRDAKLNAVNLRMFEGLRDAVSELRDRDDLRALVIGAEGRYFTAGIDFRTGDDDGLDVESGMEWRRNVRRYHVLFDEIEAVEKPVILAAQGPCLGVGVELAASCDFRLASSHATFGLPEMRNYGILPGSGGISRLTRLVGPSWARWMAMAGQPVNAERALVAGFVQEVYDAETFSTAVSEFVNGLTSMPAEALGLAKLAIDAAVNADRATARDFDRIANSALRNGSQ